MHSTLILIMLCGISSNPTHAPKEDPDAKLEMLQAHILELFAWDSGDYLMQSDRTINGYPVDGETGKRLEDSYHYIEESKQTIRFAFDYRAERYLYVRLQKRERHLFDADGGEVILKNDGFPSITEKVVAFISDKKKKTRVVRSGNLATRDVPMKASLDMLFSSSGVPDLRFAGLNSFDSQQKDGELESFTKLILDPDRLRQTTNVGKNKTRLEFIILKRPEDGSDLTFVEIDIDTATFVPTRMVGSVVGATSLSPRFKLQEEYIEWQPRDGINVPTKVRSSRKISRLIAGKRMHCDQEDESNIRWHSLNLPLDESLFDVKNVHDLAKARELLKWPEAETN